MQDNKIYLGGERSYFESINEADRANFLMNCSAIFNNPSFKKVYEFLINDSVVWMAREAQDMNQLCVGRGTISGLDLFYNKMLGFSSEYEEMKSTEFEEFDKHKIISE